MELIYKREEYLKKIRGFYKDDMIKVITGIRRCGKSYLLKSIILELKDEGIQDKDIIYIELDKKEYNDIVTPRQLEKVIDSKITDKDFKYLFIDEVQNVKGYEKVINSYREEGNISIFLTGSNSPTTEKYCNSTFFKLTKDNFSISLSYKSLFSIYFLILAI